MIVNTPKGSIDTSNPILEFAMPIRELEAIRALARTAARRASRALLRPTSCALLHGVGATVGYTIHPVSVPAPGI
jgi:hypothetical protein